MKKIRDQLLGMSKRRYKEVEIDGLEGPVWIQSLTEGENSRVQASAQNGSIEHLRPLMIMYGLIDQNKQRIFADGELDLICQLDAAITNDLFNEIQYHAMGVMVNELEAIKN